MPTDEFLGQYWGQRFCHIRGDHQRFADLFTWHDLNLLLRQHRLDFPRLRVAKFGEATAETTNRFISRSLNRRNVMVPRIDPVALNELLRDGATLIVDAIDEMVESVAALCASLEQTLHEHVQANAYVAWRTSRGFDLHWDDHDVLVIQIAGRKRWQVYEVTREAPLFRDVEFDRDGPSKLAWEGTLEDGDVLYLPRGWWHVALPQDEPTLHLTLGVNNRTGIDLLGWLQDVMRNSLTFRRDLPRFASQDEQMRHAELLRDELLARWTPHLLQQFFQDSDRQAKARPHFSLPWSAEHNVLPEDDTSRVILTAPREVELVRSEDGATWTLEALGCQFTFAESAESIVRAILNRRSTSIDELVKVGQPQFNRDDVRTFLADLVLKGLLAVDKP
jgi:ribosomal protein L16 Arg81 hydroxylase